MAWKLCIDKDLQELPLLFPKMGNISLALFPNCEKMVTIWRISCGLRLLGFVQW
jgi:hypothetical protein